MTFRCVASFHPMPRSGPPGPEAQWGWGKGGQGGGCSDVVGTGDVSTLPEDSVSKPRTRPLHRIMLSFGHSFPFQSSDIVSPRP